MRNISFKKILASALMLPFLVATGGMALAQTSAGAQGKTELLWFSQAGFRIKSPEGKMILIDPWITGGPKLPHSTKMIWLRLVRLICC